MTKRVERRLAAIFAADVAGFSRLVRADEGGTLRLLSAHRAVMDALIVEHGGRVANTAGDSVLAEFASAVDAVQCAVAVQRQLAEKGAADPPGTRLQFRIGIHVGDVMVDGGDLLGDGVNIAARLESVAEPGGVCLSGPAHDSVRHSVSVRFVDLGPRQVKNLDEPLRAFAVALDLPVSGQRGHSGDPLPALPDRPSLAVLPFSNLSQDPAQDYFVDGVAEDIIVALSRVGWLFVIARNSSFTYRGRAVEAKQIGRELGVRYLLEGSLRRSGARLRITCQVVEAASGRPVWADRFEGDLANIFDLQDRIVEEVSRAIEPNLRVAEIARVRAQPTGDLSAYDLYLRASSELYEYTAESFQRAESLLRTAIERDPNYADALASLATCVGQAAVDGWKPLQDGRAEALDLARRAARLDSASAEVLATGAYCEAVYGGSIERALDLVTAALRINPNSTHVRNCCGTAYNFAGESARAIEQFEAARRINPIDPRGFQNMTGLCAANFFARDFEASVSWGRRVLAQHPDHNVAKRFLAAALAQLGSVEEARAVIAELLRSQPGSSLTRSRGSLYRRSWMLDLYLDGLRKAGLPD